MHNIHELIIDLPFYKDLTNTDVDDLVKTSIYKEFKKGDIISDTSGNNIGPFLIISGEVRVLIDDIEHHQITLYKLYAKEMALLSATCIIEHITFDAVFETQMDTAILILNHDVLKQIMNTNLKVRCAIFEQLTDRFSFTIVSIQQILFTSYESRLSSFLVEQYLFKKQKEIKITQEEVAKATSTSREVAGRGLRKLVNQKLVKISRGVIKIIDIEGLKDLISG